MKSDQPTGVSVRDWANASVRMTKHETKNPEETVYEFKKHLVVNGVDHFQWLCLNQLQLRSIGIDHGL